jgi:hypothetical protein
MRLISWWPETRRLDSTQENTPLIQSLPVDLASFSWVPWFQTAVLLALEQLPSPAQIPSPEMLNWPLVSA